MMKGKTKVTLIILEILIAVGILAVPLFWAQKIARAASTGKAMMVYREGVVDIPRYRIWTGSSWDPEATAQDVSGDNYWIVLKSCPKRNEKILGVLDHLYDINVQVWDGSTWGNLKPDLTTAAGTRSTRAFDIAYEQSSGDAIVVFADNTTSPKYYSWNGSEWGTVAESAVAVATGDIEWVVLASKPDADEIILATQDTNYDIYAQIWNGSSWGNLTYLGKSEVRSNQGFDVAYEQSSGRAMVVYVNMNLTDYIPYYSIWDGSSGAWVSGGEAASRGGYDLRWLNLASKPSSNQIMLGTLDDDYDIHAEIWYSGNTEGWSMYTGDLTQNSGKFDKRVFDIAYESSSGEGIIVWRDNTDTVKYSPWDGSAWGAGGATSSPTAGALPHWVRLASHPDANEIMLLTINAIDDATAGNDEINIQKWDGSSWGSIATVESSSYSDYEGMAIDYDRHSSQVSIVIQKWRELYQ